MLVLKKAEGGYRIFDALRSPGQRKFFSCLFCLLYRTTRNFAFSVAILLYQLSLNINQIIN